MIDERKKVFVLWSCTKHQFAGGQRRRKLRATWSLIGEPLARLFVCCRSLAFCHLVAVVVIVVVAAATVL